MAILVAAFLALPAGCRSATKPERPTGPAVSSMEALAALYARYVGRNQGNIPPDEAVFKNYIRSEGKTLLAQRGITDVDSLFVSPRDGKPVVVAYKKTAAGREFSPELMVAYEQTGLDGRRLVAFSSGSVREINQAAFDAMNQASPK
jgi:hypothetical protein